MATKLRLVPETEQDLRHAYLWYEGQRVGLGEEFLGCVEACIEAICRTPEWHEIVYKAYRRACEAFSLRHLLRIRSRTGHSLLRSACCAGTCEVA